MQERLNAVQEELKQEVAAAELARSHAMTVLRKQQTLKEVCSRAKADRMPAPANRAGQPLRRLSHDSQWHAACASRQQMTTIPDFQGDPLLITIGVHMRSPWR